MDALCTLIRRLIITAIVGIVLIVGFFFTSAQVQLANRQAQVRAEVAEACGRWATHTEDRIDRLIGRGDCH